MPALEPLQRHVATTFRKMQHDDVTIVEPRIDSTTACKPTVDVDQFGKKHGYTTYMFTCEKTGEAISINVNYQCLNAEGMEIHCATASTARALLAFALGYLQSIGVEYVEGYCPANRPGLQTAFLGAGFVPFGYVPVWNKDARTGLFVDHVIFGWSKAGIDPAKTAFTAKSGRLATVLHGLELTSRSAF